MVETTVYPALKINPEYRILVDIQYIVSLRQMDSATKPVKQKNDRFRNKGSSYTC
jgi:hypothetical protein